MLGGFRIAVMGASGYAGMALVSYLMRYRECVLYCLTAHQGAGSHLATLHPRFESLGKLGMLAPHRHVLEQLQEIDVIYLALPHGVSQQWVSDIRKQESQLGIERRLVIDLSGDYRLTCSDYEKWYGQTHLDIENLKDMVYGLAPLFEVSKGIKSISNPGCYPTASLLAVAPLLVHDFVDSDDLVIDAKSGVSGAGRNLTLGNLYCEANENLKPYSVGNHRHTPEIEYHLSRFLSLRNQSKKCVVQFTPHLVPMQNGLLASVYGRYKGVAEEMPSDEKLLECYRSFYADSPVVKVISGMPETRWATGTPYAYIGVKSDSRTKRMMAFCAIDNTLMGAATQAIYNMNLALGLEPLAGIG